MSAHAALCKALEDLAGWMDAASSPFEPKNAVAGRVSARVVAERIREAIAANPEPGPDWDQWLAMPRPETGDGGIEDDGMVVCAGSGIELARAGVDDNPNWLRNKAVNLLNMADYLEKRDQILAAKEAQAIAARNKRRDELAAEFTSVRTYNGQLPYTQRLIDRIIHHEGGGK